MTGQRPYDAAGAHAGRRPVRRCPAAGRWRGRRPSAAGRRGGGRCGSLPGAVLRWDGRAMLPDRQRIARMRWVPFRTIDGRLTTVAASPDVPEARVCSMLRWMDGRVHAAAPLSALLQPSGRGLCRRPSAGVVADRAVLAAAEDRAHKPVVWPPAALYRYRLGLGCRLHHVQPRSGVLDRYRATALVCRARTAGLAGRLEGTSGPTVLGPRHDLTRPLPGLRLASGRRWWFPRLE